MPIQRHLVMTLGFKAAHAVPKVLYIGYDTDEARAALENAQDKGYYEIKVCRDPDRFFVKRWKAPVALPVVVVGSQQSVPS